MDGPALVKLGGSLVTDKAQESMFRPEAAQRLVGEIAQARVPTVLLNGAGSFGHPQAARAHLDHAFDARQRAGVAGVMASLADLSASILVLAHRAGLAAVPVPVHLEATTRRGRLKWDAGHVHALLKDGFTPVLHGTLVRGPDRWEVVSADALLAHLAGELEPRACIWATDVDGVLDRDPRDPAAKPVPEVSSKDAAARRAGTAGTGTDVTGRMQAKLAHAHEAARHAPTWILNGNAPGRLLAALQGRPIVGTRVRP